MKKFRVGFPLDIVGVSLAAATQWQEVEAEDAGGALKVAAINITAKWAFGMLEHILSLKGTYEEIKEGLNQFPFTDPIEVDEKPYKRGDKVRFLGGTSQFLGQHSDEPVDATYIWAAIPVQEGVHIYVIQHQNGLTKESLMAMVGSTVPQIMPAINLQDGKKYTFVTQEQLIKHEN